MVAVADYAENTDNELPHYLSLGWQMERWGLPLSGGLFAQPRRIVELAETALSVYRAFSSRNRAKNAVTWAETYPDYSALCTLVDRLRDEIP